MVAVVVCLVLGLAGTAWVGDWEQVDPLATPATGRKPWAGSHPWSGWASKDWSTTRARKRLEIGLCAPLTCHNFLLWGLAGALWAALEAIIVIQDFIYLSVGDWSGALGIVHGLLEVVPVGIIWLVFFAPAGYRRWIEGPAPA